MGQGQGRSRCALWGGISLGVGTIAYALFSPSSVGCSTNVVVLTHSAVTERGCAVFSVMSHTGVGLMVLGGVLLLGSFALALRERRQGPSPLAVVSPVAVPEPPVGVGDAAVVTETASSAAVSMGAVSSPGLSGPPEVVSILEAEPDPAGPRPVEPEPVVTQRPIAPGEHVYEPVPERLLGMAEQLPPGWYGNPDIPGKPVQWWDGTKLTDGPQ